MTEKEFIETFGSVEALSDLYNIIKATNNAKQFDNKYGIETHCAACLVYTLTELQLPRKTMTKEDNGY